MDFRLLDPNAAARGTQQVNQWADAYAQRRAGAALADGNGIGATDILNRNGLLDQAQTVLDNEWTQQDRQHTVNSRARAEQEAAEAKRLQEEAREAEVLGTMAQNLRGVMSSRGAEAVLPAFDMLAQTWLAQGADAEQIAQMRAGLEADPELFLTSVAGASEQALERYKFFQNGGSIFRADQLTGDAREVARGDRYEAVDPTKDFIRIPGMGPDGASEGAGGRPDVRPAAVPAEAEALVGDRDAVIRTMIAEARSEGPQGMQAVAAVILNRANQTGKTAAEIVAERGQFEPHMTADGRARMARIDPNSEEYRVAAAALDAALAGDDPTGGADHFYSPGAQRALGRNAPSWDNGEGQDIGNHRFFRLGYGSGDAPPRPPQDAPQEALPPYGGGVEVVRPGRPRASAQYRAATAAELAGYPPGTAAQVDTTTGQLTNIRTPPAGRAAAGGQAGGRPPRLPPQQEIDLQKMRTQGRELAATADLYREWITLNQQVDTGGMMALPGAATARGAVDAKVARMNAIQARLTPQQRQGMPGAASDRDVAMFGRSTVGVGNPRAANEATARAGIAFAQRQGDYVAFMEQFARDNGTILGAQEQWNQYTEAQPLFSQGRSGFIQTNRVVPWRDFFRRQSPSAPNAPAAGAPRRRRYNAATGRVE